eukprot:CAMPEP_0115321088 /NCGR_PEP_ID=MMETSP0270-20121206/80671_1 /TAXON_ID=71861 /ORGANISM="Scrippsiella trochoidea, Strain CCMP3099" /LENGTH=54 /DNA_ID=CAMNT_0002740941 /DNA_START=46 /DNA_END=206 /DNA_ORIENTATION=-
MTGLMEPLLTTVSSTAICVIFVSSHSTAASYSPFQSSRSDSAPGASAAISGASS